MVKDGEGREVGRFGGGRWEKLPRLTTLYLVEVWQKNVTESPHRLLY